MKPLSKFLTTLLENTIWIGQHEIVEVNPGDFTVCFDNDADAKKFQKLMERKGATASIHSCH